MEASISRGKRRNIRLEDDQENAVELKYRSRGDRDVNVASTASDHVNSVADLKAECDSEADEFKSGNVGFRDEDVMISGGGKRRKLGFEDEENVNIQLRRVDGDVNFNENIASTTTVCDTSNHVMINSLADLKAVCDSETDIFVSGNDGSRASSTSSAVCFEPEEMETSSTTIEASSRRKPPPETAVTMPSAAELEEFFAKAEKYEQKRFVEKYNFDIMKDVPMEGRYQWVPLKP